MKYWQWMDNAFGPMGWFNDDERRELTGHQEFQNGHWREVSEEELKINRAWLTRLYCKQA